MARRVARPAALRVTWVIAPWPISAHAVTLVALLVALAAAAAFARGTTGGWMLGAILLQVWYLLDHVDGQVARWRRTESLDGVALDYLMHHLVNLFVPLGMGLGVAVRTLQPEWGIAGLAWSAGLLTIGLLDDVRYKAFVQRLKRLRGELRVVGGGGGRPRPAGGMPRNPRQSAAWLGRKLCEMHAAMNVLSVVALIAWSVRDEELWLGRACLTVFSLLSMVAAVRSVARSLREGAAEREFAAWYRVGAGDRLQFDGHWWTVDPEGGKADERLSRRISGDSVFSDR